MVQIVASIITNSQRDLDNKLGKIKGLVKRIQLDVMDGKFVKNKSLMFDFKIPKGFYVEVHLMHNNPVKWIKKNGKKVDLIIVHYNVVRDNFDEILKVVKGKKIGMAINPEVSVSKIKKFLNKLDFVTVMAVHPGKYGSKLIPSTLNKISQIKKLNKEVKVEVDGHQDDKTINKSIKKGADFIISGSFIFKNRRLMAKDAVSVLKKAINR